jgi:hypothetical protein
VQELEKQLEKYLASLIPFLRKEAVEKDDDEEEEDQEAWP